MTFRFETAKERWQWFKRLAAEFNKDNFPAHDWSEMGDSLEKIYSEPQQRTLREPELTEEDVIKVLSSQSNWEEMTPEEEWRLNPDFGRDFIERIPGLYRLYNRIDDLYDPLSIWYSNGVFEVSVGPLADTKDWLKIFSADNLEEIVSFLFVLGEAIQNGQVTV